MGKKCFYIVGSGIVGSVIAHELAVMGNKVILWERRNHSGGNLFDFEDKFGIHVQMYGPHIFHTNNDYIWEYVNKYCVMKNYNLICGSMIDGVCVPTAFDFEAIDTFFPEEADEIKTHIKYEFGNNTSASILDMLESEDTLVKKIANFLYDKDYAPYTAKQWGINPSEVDKNIFKRVPVMFSYGSKYFNDKYQAIPLHGYMELIDNLLDHENIDVCLGVEALEFIHIENKNVYIDDKILNGKLIYTGPIDELFGCAFGKLPYRSLRFEWKHENIESFQNMPVVAYPQAEGYTRITEYKKLPFQDVEGTTYAIEYPLPYKNGENNEPYYPVLTKNSIELYEKYKDLADNVENLVCCGRLADFKYYNMDQAIERALKIVETIK